MRWVCSAPPGHGGGRRASPALPARDTASCQEHAEPFFRCVAEALRAPDPFAGFCQHGQRICAFRRPTGAGLSEVTPHTLRHTFGKRLVEAEVDLSTVAALLGHERLDTTAIYTQPGARDLEQAVARLEQDAALTAEGEAR